MTPERSREPVSPQEDLFEGGPPLGLTALARLPVPACPNIVARALLVVALGWLPLLVLTIVAPAHNPQLELESFIHDIGVHARFAAAAPLFVIAHVVCARRLGAIAYNFSSSGVLQEDDLPELAREIEISRRLVNSHWAELMTAILAYGAVFALLGMDSSRFDLASWASPGDGVSPSFAGWWQVLVSLPLLLMLLLGWVWRILVWTRLLHKIARMDLVLIAAHPDHAGGLGFLAQSVRAFTIVGAGLGSITAGRFAQVNLLGTASQFTNGFLIGGTVLIVLVICVGPLLAFSQPMMLAWRSAAMEYGALGTTLGVRFERKWLPGSKDDQSEMLSVGDFSAATDLYSVVANVFEMRAVPVDKRSMIMLVAATMAPFVPGILLSMPVKVLLTDLRGLLL